jgi:hypothetical protein
MPTSAGISLFKMLAHFSQLLYQIYNTLHLHCHKMQRVLWHFLDHTLYDIILQWYDHFFMIIFLQSVCSCTCKSDQNVSVDQNVTNDHTFEVVTKILVEHEFFKKVFESVTPDLNIMEWSQHCPLYWVRHQACINSLTWHLTQHNGLDYSIVR